MSKAIQDHYPDDLAHCYGCGRNNPQGHRLKSYWRDGVTVASFTPAPWHTAIPGFVYGGLIASLIDCHATGTAAAAATLATGRTLGDGEILRYVTAALQVDYVAPTPAGVELQLQGRAAEVGERKVIVEVELSAGDALCARGRVVAVRMPAQMRPRT